MATERVTTARREALRIGAGGLLMAALPAAAALPPRPEPAIDLLVRGGTVLDPASGMKATADVAIAPGASSRLRPRSRPRVRARSMRPPVCWSAPAWSMRTYTWPTA
ncbi:MAG: hypothetical protein R3E68_14640 [Burkholderiaceae bacterium]